MTTRYRLHVSDSLDDLSRLCGEEIANAIDQALAEHNRVQIALAGGETPKAAYRALARQHLPWDRVDVLLGDERWVPADDPSSNARMLRETLLVAGEPATDARFHPVPTALATPQDSADAYAALLQQLCPGRPPQLGLVLLGLGDDGHTASLFPGTAAPRVTLTAPVLSAARRVIFLVSGAGKRQALARLLDAAEPAQRTPAKLVQPSQPVLVLADRDAAADLAGG